MWKVMIADDEPNIRRGLRYLLEQDEADLQIIGEAENGLTALQMIKETQPDILLLDICMPYLNGLDLVSQVNALLNQSKVIIVTGHDEFEYAQEALKLKVFDYILKPISQKLFYEVIKKAKDELEQLRTNNKYIRWAAEQLKRNIPYFRERILNDFINNKLSPVELEEQMEFLKMNFGQCEYERPTKELKEIGRNSPILMRAKKFIEENYSKEELSRQDVAEAIGISSSYLSRLFKEEEGYSFTEYMTLVRIKHATKLMDDPLLKIYDIASRVGYSTQHYFSAAFKKVLGVSPIEFRNGGK